MSKRKKQEDIDFENPPQVSHSQPNSQGFLLLLRTRVQESSLMVCRPSLYICVCVWKKQIPDNAFSLASNEGSISLSSTLGQAPTLLPDDHHYQPKSLAKPFLRPRKLLGRLLLGRSQMPTVSPGVDAEEETNDLESANVIERINTVDIERKNCFVNHGDSMVY